MPTISLDHCFLGSEDSGANGAPVPALENPFLVMYDADSEARCCLPVSGKAVNEYVIYVLLMSSDTARSELHSRMTPHHS